MNTPSPTRRRLTRGALVAAVVGCAACCAAPLIAIAGGVGLLALIGAYWVPALLALAVVAAAVTVVLVIRRRRARACRLPNVPRAIPIDADQSGEPVSAAAPSRP